MNDGHASEDRTHETIVKLLLDVLREKSGLSNDDWTGVTKLVDMGIDSFEFVNYIFDIEDKIGYEINFSAVKSDADLQTIDDLAAFIRSQAPASRI